MRCDVVSFVALDFVLWLILGGSAGVTFVVEIFGMHFDNLSADMSGFRDLLAFLMEDCCNGSPELCQPVIEAITCAC